MHFSSVASFARVLSLNAAIMNLLHLKVDDQSVRGRTSTFIWMPPNLTYAFNNYKRQRESSDHIIIIVAQQKSVHRTSQSVALFWT